MGFELVLRAGKNGFGAAIIPTSSVRPVYKLSPAVERLYPKKEEVTVLRNKGEEEITGYDRNGRAVSFKEKGRNIDATI